MYFIRDLNNRRLTKILFTLSMVLAFTTTYGDFRFGNTFNIYIGVVWITFAFVKLAKNNFRSRSETNQDIAFMLKVYIIPCNVLHLYTIILIILGIVQKEYFTSNLTVYIPFCLAFAAIYLFGKEAMVYCVYAAVLSWLLSVSVSFMMKGPKIFTNAIIQGWVDSHYHINGFKYNYLELGDLCFALGYFLVLYTVTRKQIKKKDAGVIGMILLILFLGVKRSAILGFGAVILLKYIVNSSKKGNQLKWCRLIRIFLAIAAVTFVWLIFSWDKFVGLLNLLHVDTMGRLYFYKAITEYGKLAPSFVGIGKNVVSALLNRGDLTYLHVGGLHSDILKIYIENGFFVFFLWLYYYLHIIPKKYMERFGKNSVIIYTFVMVYAIALYFTDNTENYFICQLFQILVPLSYAISTKSWC